MLYETQTTFRATGDFIHNMYVICMYTIGIRFMLNVQKFETELRCIVWPMIVDGIILLYMNK